MTKFAALTIGRIRLRQAGSVQRGRAARARLEALAPDQPGPPAEVLILRRLADPMSGAMMRDRPAWDAALSTTLALARRRAVRPALGPVPADADAVRFTDIAEAMACLLEDRAAGRAMGWWWWAFVRALPPPVTRDRTGIEAILAARPELVAAVLAVLAERGTAGQVLSQLPAEVAPRLARMIGAPPPEDLAEPRETAEPRIPLFAALPGPTAWLLASAQVLRRHPNLPQAERARLARDLLRGAVAPRGETVTRGSSADRPETSLPVPAPSVRPPPSREPGQQAEGESTVPAPIVDAKAAPPDDTRSGEAPAPTFAPERPERVGRSGPRSPQARRETPQPARPDAEPMPPPQPTDDGVRTERAGIFYLINLFEHPDLFPMPAEPAARPWAQLDLLARALAPREPATDPVWRLLALLDGRDADEPPDAAGWPGLPAAIPVLAGRLTAAMKVAPAEVSPTLIVLPGVVFVTPAHLDVVIPMAELRLPVRRAGLDLDPGWSPRFGRIITFHYRD